MSSAATAVRLRENAEVAPSKRFPRKNDPASIAARRETLGLDGDAELGPYVKAAETVTGVATIPVSVAELHVSLGQYELNDRGDVVEIGRETEDVVVPL